MMKMSFEVTAKKLFGVNYEQLIRTLFLELVVFWGLHISGFQVEIAPSILYLMAGAFSAGVMWQALSSDRNRANLENMLMLHQGVFLCGRAGGLHPAHQDRRTAGGGLGSLRMELGGNLG